MAGKGGKRRTSWPKGKSGNPKGGRPKSDQTWGAIFSQFAHMTPAAAAAKCHAIAGQLAGLGDKITLQEAIVIRVYSALLFEPSGSLLDKVMARMDGLLPIPMNISWREEAEKRGLPASEVFEKMVQAAVNELPDAD